MDAESAHKKAVKDGGSKLRCANRPGRARSLAQRRSIRASFGHDASLELKTSDFEFASRQLVRIGFELRVLAATRCVLYETSAQQVLQLAFGRAERRVQGELIACAVEIVLRAIDAEV